MMRQTSPSPRLALALSLLALACSERASRDHVLDASLIELADHREQSELMSGGAPMAARQQRRWSFHQPQPAWQPLSEARLPRLARVATEPVEGALRVVLLPPTSQSTMLLIGGLQTELDEGLALADFEAVQIRARSSAQFAGVTVAYNVDDEGAIPSDMQFFFSTDEAPPVFSDGSEQTYSIPLRPRAGAAQDAALESLAIVAATVSPAALDILSIELVPRGAAFLDDSGVRHVSRSGETRNTLFAHTPAAISFALRVPAEGRFDVGLSTSPGETVAYRLTVREGSAEPIVLLAETIDDSDAWQQRSVDLANFAGRSVDLVLAAESPTPGKIALWGAPVVSGRDHSPRPNVIFYIIDGGGADLMSAYGYARRTTPFLEELAGEGVVFDRAFSNATWTQPSTASFMTSLHHSVLGGLRRGVHSTPIPSAATPMAVHMRRGGYQTASFSANPNSGRIIGVERGVDVLRDGATPHHSTSSVELHEQFWRWRENYPGSPYWVHFQTTDVHEPNVPVEPFAGLFVTPGEQAQLQQWDQQIFNTAGQLFGRTSIIDFYDLALEQTGIPRQDYFGTRRGLYDETMAHQDRQLRDLVTKLKARGEWENTLLVIGADHGHPAGSFARWGRGLFEPQPAPWEGALFDAYASRVPLIFVWPGHIPAGRRFSEPVSMIDVLPTILDLVDLPQPEVLQGQSLAELLITGEQELRPVVFDEFRVENDTGAMIGNLDIVDGRWGASLEIGPPVAGEDPDRGRHAVPIGGRWGAVHPWFPQAPRLLLYDLDNDPFARAAVNDEHPDLVAKYQAQLLDLWQAHQALAGRFKDAGEIVLSPEQLRQLRALGYIQ